MEFTLRDVVRYNTVFKNIIDQSSIPGQLKFRFLTALKQFEPATDNLTTIRNELIAKYGSEQPGGGYGILEPVRENFDSDEAFQEAIKHYNEQLQLFDEEMNKVMDETINIDFNKFDVSIMNSSIPADALLLIYDLIEA